MRVRLLSSHCTVFLLMSDVEQPGRPRQSRCILHSEKRHDDLPVSCFQPSYSLSSPTTPFTNTLQDKHPTGQSGRHRQLRLTVSQSFSPLHPALQAKADYLSVFNSQPSYDPFVANYTNQKHPTEQSPSPRIPSLGGGWV